MIRYLIYLTVVATLAILTVIFSRFFNFYGVVPDFLLLFVTLVAVQEERYDFYFVAILSGLYLDLASGLPVGSTIFGFVLVGFVSHFLYHQVIYYVFSWKQLPLLVIMNIVIVQVCVLGFLLVATHYGAMKVLLPLRLYPFRLAIEIIYSLVFMYPLYWLSSVVSEVISKREQARRMLR